MKFEVSAVRKTDIIQDRSNIKLSSVESPLANQNINNFAADATVTTMAKVDALPVCLPNHFIKTGNTGSELQPPVSHWTQAQVLDWLNSMNLFPLTEVFRMRSISGAELMAMNGTILKEMGIEDTYQRQTLLLYIDQLCGRTSATEDDSEGSSTESADECTSDFSEHNLQEHLFPTTVRCHKCRKYMGGLNGQGYQCAACGLCLHADCTQLKIQPCNSEKLEARRKSHQHAHSHGLMFGPNLCRDVPNSQDQEVPDVLYACTKEIELRLSSQKDLDPIEAYKVQKNCDEVCSLKKAFDSSDEASVIPLLDVELSTLCGVIKKYLRDLSNPLIPIEWYEEYIIAAKQSPEAESMTTLRALLNHLPKNHTTPLQFMFTHFYKVSEYQHQQNPSISIANAYQALADIFCHIILRPDWSAIGNMIKNTKHHVTLIHRLFIHYDNNNTESDKNLPTSSDIDSTTTRVDAECSARTRQAEVPYSPPEEGAAAAIPTLPLDKYAWYWGEVSRDEISDATKDVDDGSYLVRNATKSHTTHGDYTLVLRKGGGNLLIKIYHRQGRYGFCSDSCPFDSVPDLVSYYQHHSLAEYNTALNIRLHRGIARPSSNQYEVFRKSDPNYLLKALRRNQAEIVSLTRECDALLEKRRKTTVDIHMLHQAQESFRELSKTFEERLEQYTTERTTTTVASASDNEINKNAAEVVIRERLSGVNFNKEQLGGAIQDKKSENSSIVENINVLEPKLDQLSRNQENLVSALVAHGISRHELDHVLYGDPHPHKPPHTSMQRLPPSPHISTDNRSSRGVTVVSKPDIHHAHRSNWYVNCSRTEAISILQKCEDGTFLLRPGSQDNHPFSLSIVISGLVGHCKVLYQDALFGFAEPFIIHKSIEELVLHYKDHSLANHNPQLNTKLLYPVNQPT